MAKSPNKLLLRDDEIGALARRLLGNDDTPPDLTAAVPLYDAFRISGYAAAAERLLSNMSDLVRVFQRIESGEQPRPDEMADLVRYNLSAAVSEFEFDFNSMCLFCAQVMESDAQPVELDQRKVELDTVRVAVIHPVSPGARVQLPDRRVGIVVSYADGYANAVPVEEEMDNYPQSFSDRGTPARSTRRRR